MISKKMYMVGLGNFEWQYWSLYQLRTIKENTKVIVNFITKTFKLIYQKYDWCHLSHIIN